MAWYNYIGLKDPAQWEQEDIERKKQAISSGIQALFPDQQVPFVDESKTMGTMDDPLYAMTQYDPMMFVKNLPGIMPQQADVLAGAAATNQDFSRALIGMLLPERKPPEFSFQDIGVGEEKDPSGKIISKFQTYAFDKNNPLRQVPLGLPFVKGSGVNINTADPYAAVPPGSLWKPGLFPPGTPLPPVPAMATKEWMAQNLVQPSPDMTSDKAGKILLADLAQIGIKGTSDLLFDGGDVIGGKINKDGLLGADFINDPPLNIKELGRFSRFLSGPRARELATNAENVRALVVRTTSGAALNADEQKNVMIQLLPLSTDSDQTIRKKMIMQSLFSNGVKEYLDTNTYYKKNAQEKAAFFNDFLKATEKQADDFLRGKVSTAPSASAPADKLKYLEELRKKTR